MKSIKQNQENPISADQSNKLESNKTEKYSINKTWNNLSSQNADQQSFHSLSQLKKLVAEFIKSKDLKANSIKAYQSDLTFFVNYTIAHKLHLSSLNRGSLLEWLKQGFAPRRIANRRGVNIRLFLIWCAKTKSIKIDPDFFLPWQFTDPKPINTNRSADLTEEECEELLNTKKLNCQKKTLLCLLLESGASLEELATLNWTQISMQKPSYLKFGEYGKERIIPLGSKASKLLLDLKKENDFLIEQCRPELDQDGQNELEVNSIDSLVFIQKNAKESISAAYMAVMIRRATLKILEREISPTQLQDYCKKKILESKSPQEASEILGRKNLSTITKSNNIEFDIERLRQIHRKVFAAL
jgi:integrase/recombinase XerD